jgi:hypothetical protein
MSINLNVKISADGYLDVDQSGNANHVPKDANPQTITWKLIGNANGGTFNLQTATNPGLTWVGPNQPQYGIFGYPVVEANGNMSVTDSNLPGSPSATYTYKLCATINGQQYSTVATLRNPKQVTHDPTIVNN